MYIQSKIVSQLYGLNATLRVNVASDVHRYFNLLSEHSSWHIRTYVRTNNAECCSHANLLRNLVQHI